MSNILSEAQVTLLKEGLDFLLEKYDIDSPHFHSIIDVDYPELENRNFEDIMVDISMNDEVDLDYSIDDMLRYLPDINQLKYNDNSAWCNKIKQFIIDVEEWEPEKVNLYRFSYKSENISIRFVKNPFYIGVAAVEQGIADDNYCITPCSRYFAVELEYIEDRYLSREEELKLIKQFLHSVTIETGVSLKFGKFFFFDYYDYYIDEEDNSLNICIEYKPEDLLYYTKAMDYFSKAIEIKDEEIKFLHFYKIIEYFSPVASKKSAYHMLNLRLDALRVKNRDQKYLESIFQLTRDYDTSLKDKELATTVLRECADSLELFDVLPETIQQQIKKRLHIQKNVVHPTFRVIWAS